MAGKFQMIEWMGGDGNVVIELPKEEIPPAIGASVTFELPEGLVVFKVMDHAHTYRLLEEGAVASELRVIMVRMGSQSKPQQPNNGAGLRSVKDAPQA